MHKNLRQVIQLQQALHVGAKIREGFSGRHDEGEDVGGGGVVEDGGEGAAVVCGS